MFEWLSIPLALLIIHTCFSISCLPARENKAANYLCGRKQTYGSSSTDETDSAPPPGHERCSYCGSVMSSLRLLMHQKHCAQSTFKCSICGYVCALMLYRTCMWLIEFFNITTTVFRACLPKAAEQKHRIIAHNLLRCDCGLELTQVCSLVE